jgi:quinol monooxygenase YgiN
MSTHVIATIVPKPEHADALEKQLRKMVGLTRKEPGNRRYDLFRETREGKGPALHLYEIYVDRAAFDAHLATEHFQELKSKLPEWLAEPPEIRVLENLDVAP